MVNRKKCGLGNSADSALLFPASHFFFAIQLNSNNVKRVMLRISSKRKKSQGMDLLTFFACLLVHEYEYDLNVKKPWCDIFQGYRQKKHFQNYFFICLTINSFLIILIFVFKLSQCSQLFDFVKFCFYDKNITTHYCLVNERK